MLFSNSTQKKHWIFPSVEEVRRLREEANTEFIQKIGFEQMTVSPMRQFHIYSKNIDALFAFFSLIDFF